MLRSLPPNQSVSSLFAVGIDQCPSAVFRKRQFGSLNVWETELERDVITARGELVDRPRYRVFGPLTINLSAL